MTFFSRKYCDILHTTINITALFCSLDLIKCQLLDFSWKTVLNALSFNFSSFPESKIRFFYNIIVEHSENFGRRVKSTNVERRTSRGLRACIISKLRDKWIKNGKSG